MTPAPPTSNNKKDGAPSPLQQQGREVFGAAGAGEASQSDVPDGGWVILLETFNGANASDAAAMRLQPVRELLGRSDVRVEVRGQGAALVLGGYEGPKDPRAKKDLVFLQQLVQNNDHPYAKAYLLPTAAHDRGRMPEYDLAGARPSGSKQVMYTVQIGVYEKPEKPAEAKRAAEDAAKLLRAKGEKAFYYHTPLRSMVTIGVFGPRDIDERTGKPRSAEIARIQREYPLNLLNGQFAIKSNGGAEQPSALVQVP